MMCALLGLALASCNQKSSPTAPVKAFHITNPANGSSFDMGSQVWLKWALPPDSSIKKVIIYQALYNQDFVPLNQYTPVVAPTDSFQLFIGSDNPGKPLRIKIESADDSTKSDMISINENPYQS